MEFKTIAQAKRDTGLSYIGKLNNGSKHAKAYKYNELVYTIYFAPANSSGHEVCEGRSKGCTAACLNMSGYNRMDTKANMINRSRIKKTKLFFEHREFTSRWIFEEIKNGYRKAQLNNMSFSVRLNNTSDISPEDFRINVDGITMNILEYFPDIQFYDYTKIPERVLLASKYPNYDITFSYNGENIEDCHHMLKNNIRVAMVFEKGLPNVFLGYPVINADLYDMRYRDANNVIAGLHYKKVRTKLSRENKFVIQDEK